MTMPELQSWTFGVLAFASLFSWGALWQFKGARQRNPDKALTWEDVRPLTNGLMIFFFLLTAALFMATVAMKAS